MREIEYRGKTDISIDDLEFKNLRHKNNWVYGTYMDGFIINGVVEANEEYIAIETWCPVERKTIGQYTGLKDTHNVKIYENDILKYTNWRNEESIIQVWWDEDFVGFNFGNRKLTMIKDKLEVIGNTYDNPELLKGC